MLVLLLYLMVDSQRLRILPQRFQQHSPLNSGEVGIRELRVLAGRVERIHYHAKLHCLVGREHRRVLREWRWRKGFGGVHRFIVQLSCRWWRQ